MLVHSTSLPEDSKFYHETESLPISTNEDESYLYDINQSRNRIILESFIYKYSDEITNAFLGYYCGKPKEIFIVSYFKKPATKIKYWTEFEHLRVLNIDYKFVSSEATETIYSKECIENKINFQEMEKMAALITANSDSLMEKHTNLQMISGCSVRSKNRKILVETCIVFYCKTKEIIPLGEELFPQKLGEYNIDVREGMFSWTPGDVLLQHPNNPHNPLKMGCNIGLKVKEGERVSIGSLGGFVDFEDGLGFLTCAHVLYDEGQLIEGALPKESDYVVQPAGCNQEDECGKVVRYVFDPEGPIGVDAALVHVTKRCPDQGMFTGLSKDNMESAGFNFDEPLRYNSGRMRRLGEEDMDRRFIKSGAATYLTRGVLHFNGASVKVFDKKVRLNREGKEYAMKAQIEVRGLSGDVFAQPGDSGSFVFIVENDKSLVCIGMVEGWTTHYTAIVTPITDILQKLDLDSTQLHKFADQPSMEVG